MNKRLTVLVFLEFFIWGAWLPLIFDYLQNRGYSPVQQSWILSAPAIAALFSALWIGGLADRRGIHPWLLAVGHLMSGASLLGLAWAADFATFFGLMLAHSLCFVPTIFIAAALARNSAGDERQAAVRFGLWGAAGWIAAAWPSVWFPERTSMFYVAGGASLLAAALSFAVPRPRTAAAGHPFSVRELFRVITLPQLTTLLIVIFIAAALQQCYYIWTDSFLQRIGVARHWTSAVMSLAPLTAIVALLALEMVRARLGWRATMVLGMLATAAQFAVCAFFPSAVPVTASIALNGVCWAFIFAAGWFWLNTQMAQPAAAIPQTVVYVLVLGLGPLAANFLSPQLGEQAKTADLSGAVVNVSREEVMISGYVRNPRSSAFSLETLSIEEPGKPPYRRQVSLDANRKFDLTLGKPIPGTYRLAVRTRTANWLSGTREGWLNLPELVVGNRDSHAPQIVRAKDYDYQQLFLFPSLIAVVAAALLLVPIRPAARPADHSTVVDR